MNYALSRVANCNYSVAQGFVVLSPIPFTAVIFLCDFDMGNTTY